MLLLQSSPPGVSMFFGRAHSWHFQHRPVSFPWKCNPSFPFHFKTQLQLIYQFPFKYWVFGTADFALMAATSHGLLASARYHRGFGNHCTCWCTSHIALVIMHVMLGAIELEAWCNLFGVLLIWNVLAFSSCIFMPDGLKRKKIIGEISGNRRVHGSCAVSEIEIAAQKLFLPTMNGLPFFKYDGKLLLSQTCVSISSSIGRG